MKFMRWTTLVLALMCWLGASQAWAEGKAPFEVGAALGHKNMTVFPLYTPKGAQEAPQGEFLTFEEASKKKKVKVTELNGSTSDAQVNAVEIYNKSKQPLFLLAGEVILGGKQDRVISQNTVVPAGAKKFKVGVFCVEQGRWEGNKAAFKASGKIGHSKLRGAAVFGNNQGQVWAEVAEANAKNKVAPGTGTYRASLNQKKLNALVDTYMAALTPALSRDKKALGFSIAIDGEIVAVDAFMNPKLFGKVRDKLLRSYVLEAVVSKDKAKNKKAKLAKVRAFFTEIDKAKAAPKSSKSGEATNILFDNMEVEGMVTDSPQGKKVHTFYKRKTARPVPKGAPRRQHREQYNLNNLNNLNEIEVVE